MIRSSKVASVVPTPAEFRLLEVLWRIKEGTIDDILQAWGPNPPNYKTTQTLLRIMEAKKLIRHRLVGRAFAFEPRVEENQVKRLSIHSFLDRYFGGSRAELLINLLDDERIDSQELEVLEETIRRHRKARPTK